MAKVIGIDLGTKMCIRDSVHPIPGDMPGYEDKIIMAGGTFVQGSSIELSADGPVRPPYTIFMQGGLVFEHSMLGILGAAEELLKHR